MFCPCGNPTWTGARSVAGVYRCGLVFLDMVMDDKEVMTNASLTSNDEFRNVSWLILLDPAGRALSAATFAGSSQCCIHGFTGTMATYRLRCRRGCSSLMMLLERRF